LARETDVPALPAIEHAAVQMFIGYAPDSVRDDATDERTFLHAVGKGLLWVALSDITPVGFAHVEMLADDLPHLEELDVHPAHGRRGVGAALVHTVCEWAAHAGYSALTLTTFRAVPWNYPFYARLGFEEIPRENQRPELSAVVAKEAKRGLDPATRAVMRYRFA
jgi:GNAT superfamily N-acetyltransferase